MIRAGAADRALAVSLSAVAGFVDAIGYLETGGYFLSFMTGNSTRLGTGLAAGSGAALAAGLLASFVGGVIVGTLVGRAAGRHRRTGLLAFLAMALAVAASLGRARHGSVAIFAVAAAMGAENAVFEENGEVRIGLTYMTGTLVKLGQRLAGALAGGPRWAWAPHLVLWLGLVTGAVAGAAAHPRLGLDGLWVAAGAVLALSAASVVLPCRERDGGT